MQPELEQLAAELWEFGLENSPSSATLLGDHRFDHLIEDLSEEHEAVQREQLLGFAKRAEAMDPVALTHAEQVTREVIIGECRKNVAVIDSEIAEMRSDQLVSPHASLMHVVPQWMFPQPEHAEAYLERLHAIPRALEQALVRYRSAIGKGRPPARLTVVRSLSMLDGYLASPPDADMFAIVGGPEEWDGDAAWRDRLRVIVRDTLRPAVQRYRDVFESELLPVARPDDRCGLTWVEGGDEIYATAVTEHTGLELSPDEIHEIGMDDIKGKLAAEYAEIGERVFGTRDVPAILDHLRRDPDLRFSDSDEIMDTAGDILARAKGAIGEWFGVLPQADCLIAPIPEYMAKDLPAASLHAARPGRVAPRHLLRQSHRPAGEDEVSGGGGRLSRIDPRSSSATGDRRRIGAHPDLPALHGRHIFHGGVGSVCRTAGGRNGFVLERLAAVGHALHRLVAFGPVGGRYGRCTPKAGAVIRQSTFWSTTRPWPAQKPKSKSTGTSAGPVRRSPTGSGNARSSGSARRLAPRSATGSTSGGSTTRC